MLISIITTAMLLMIASLLVIKAFEPQEIGDNAVLITIGVFFASALTLLGGLIALAWA